MQFPVVSRLTVAVTAVLLAACASHADSPIAYNPPGFGTPDVPVAVDASRIYRAGAGDEITVRVLNAPEFSGDFLLDETGSFRLPLVGEVRALGLPARDIAAMLANRLGERYLRNPDVTVTFKSQSSRRIALDGSVRNPGLYSFSGNLTLMRAIAVGQGTTENANPRRVIVFRQINGVRNAAAFDLTAIREGTADDPEIYPNDVIFVDGSQTRQLFRDFLSTIPLLAIFRPF